MQGLGAATLARMIREGFSKEVAFQLSQNDEKTPAIKNLGEKCSRESYFSIHVSLK